MSRLDEKLRALAAGLRIVHHIPGRIRLGLAAGALQMDWGGDFIADVGRFCRALEGASGIRSVRFNPLARSCTVEYDPAIVSPAAWPDLLDGTASAAAGELCTVLQTAERATERT